MTVDRVRLQTKLSAILGKDVDRIMREVPDLPFLPRGYTRAQVQGWLDRRANLLSQIVDATDAQIATRAQNIYNALTPEGKAIADKINAGEGPDLSAVQTLAEHERLVALRLYRYVTVD